MVQAKDPPSHYLSKLRTYLDPKASRSHRVRLVLKPLSSLASCSCFYSVVSGCLLNYKISAESSQNSVNQLLGLANEKPKVNNPSLNRNLLFQY